MNVEERTVGSAYKDPHPTQALEALALFRLEEMKSAVTFITAN